MEFNQPPEPYVDADAVCAYLGISLVTLWQWIAQEGLPVYQVGGRGRRRFKLSEVDAWLHSYQFKRTDNPADSEDVA